MSETRTTNSGGIGLLGLLGVLFVGLKLGHIINWSWWWVTAPFWAIPALLVVILVLALIGAGIKASASTKSRRSF